MEGSGFYAEAAVAILNLDLNAVENMIARRSEESRRLADEMEILPAPGIPPSLDEFNEVVDVDPFATWFSSWEPAVEKTSRTLRRLITSWIAADYRLERWSERASFEKFMRARRTHIYQDWFNHRDGRVLQGFALRPHAPPSDYARWLFMRVIEGRFCRRIGQCQRCRRFCLSRRRSNGLFCGVTCNRLDSSRRAKRANRQRTRLKQLSIVRKAAQGISRKEWASEREWLRSLRKASNTLSKDGDISAKSVTLFVKAREVPKPEFRKRGTAKH
jgi:hypothetical protein